jgi:hypothetical protein
MAFGNHEVLFITFVGETEDLFTGFIRVIFDGIFVKKEPMY